MKHPIRTHLLWGPPIGAVAVLCMMALFDDVQILQIFYHGALLLFFLLFAYLFGFLPAWITGIYAEWAIKRGRFLLAPYLLLGLITNAIELGTGVLLIHGDTDPKALLYYLLAAPIANLALYLLAYKTLHPSAVVPQEIH